MFVGKNVAQALGYKKPSNALQVHVDTDDKTTYPIQVSGSNYKTNRTHSYYDNEGDMHTRTYLVWTERGRNFIHRLCKTEEVLIPFLLD